MKYSAVEPDISAQIRWEQVDQIGLFWLDQAKCQNILSPSSKSVKKYFGN